MVIVPVVPVALAGLIAAKVAAVSVAKGAAVMVIVPVDPAVPVASTVAKGAVIGLNVRSRSGLIAKMVNKI
jgi:hypothetical protein